MAANEVDMKIPEVQGMAKKLSEVSTVLNDIAKALEMISTALKASFFLGLIGAAAVAFIDQVRPQIQQMADRCESLSNAVTQSVNAFEQGDYASANLFMTSRGR